MSLALLVPFGIIAGFVTTAFGAGGGLLMVIGLSFFFDVPTVLAVTAPALLVGNLARAYKMRGDIHMRSAWTLIAGAVPGVVLGAYVLVVVPETALRVLLAGGVSLYVVVGLTRELAGMRKPAFMLNAPMLAGAGVATGVVAASIGGGGIVVAPALRSRNLERETFVATTAVVGAVIHISRVAGYGALGLNALPVLVGAGFLAVAVLFGNGIGHKVLDRLEPKQFRVGLLVMLAFMAVALIV